jgi:hypothetical protein
VCPVSVIGTKWNQTGFADGCMCLKTWWPGTETHCMRQFASRSVSFMPTPEEPENEKLGPLLERRSPVIALHRARVR